MGYGKGYYDRFLADPELNAWVVGICYPFQVVSHLPSEPHDRRMHALATEEGIRDC
jgi:5-formyltetrahydrofolate cyclo-ligase